MTEATPSHQETNEFGLHFPLHTELENYFKILCDVVCERLVAIKWGTPLVVSLIVIR